MRRRVCAGRRYRRCGTLSGRRQHFRLLQCNRRRRAVARHGRIDIVVNAAGVIKRTDVIHTSDEAWRHIFGVNVDGIFFMCRAVLPHMVERRSGVIVNFGSIWGDIGTTGVAAYCATKGAVHNLTRAMALDHPRDGIRILAVCPGEVDTPMLASERSAPPTGRISLTWLTARFRSAGLPNRKKFHASWCFWLRTTRAT